jgi:hypothetical protein
MAGGEWGRAPTLIEVFPLWLPSTTGPWRPRRFDTKPAEHRRTGGADEGIEVF